MTAGAPAHGKTWDSTKGTRWAAVPPTTGTTGTIHTQAKDGSKMYSFRENLTTNTMEILQHGLVIHEISMNIIKYRSKNGLDDFIKYPLTRRKVHNIAKTTLPTTFTKTL
jgi:hypothetical protein